MRITSLGLTALAFVTAVAGAAAASDDLTIVSRVSRDGKPAGTNTSYLAADHVRMAREDKHETIVDMKTGTMTELDNEKKTYSVITKQDMERLKVQMQEQMNSPEMKEARERMEKMTPAEKKQMEAAMGGLVPEFSVRRAGTSRKIAGYGCEEWTMTIGEMSRSKQCLTNDLKYPAHAWDAYKDFAEGLKSSLAMFGPLAKSGEEMAEKMKEMKGFPLAATTSIDIMGHKSTVETEVTEVRRGAIPASAWEVPAGYTKTENQMVKAFERRGHGRPRH